jgi:hypothetical protein
MPGVCGVECSCFGESFDYTRLEPERSGEVVEKFGLPTSALLGDRRIFVWANFSFLRNQPPQVVGAEESLSKLRFVLLRAFLAAHQDRSRVPCEVTR